MKPRVLMQCGHVAHAELSDGSPVCPICFGIVPGADTPAPAPSLEGRTARCVDCGRTAPSSLQLAFFHYGGESGQDTFYCGCRGWD